MRVPAVRLESRALGEPGLTLGTLEGLVSRVSSLVQREGGPGAQRLATDRTDMAHGPCSALVDLGEHLAK